MGSNWVGVNREWFMFNFTYAIIGVLIGMAVEPVGRFAKHGPSASPQWTWNKISRAYT